MPGEPIPRKIENPFQGDTLIPDSGMKNKNCVTRMLSFFLYSAHYTAIAAKTHAGRLKYFVKYLVLKVHDYGMWAMRGIQTSLCLDEC